MNKEQFLLMKLAEECTEVGKRALKQMQYGSQQVWKGNEVTEGAAPADEKELTNAQRLENELKDLAIIVNLLADNEYVDPNFTREKYDGEYEEAKAAKIAKLNKYLAFSRELGMIDKQNWTV